MQGEPTVCPLPSSIFMWTMIVWREKYHKGNSHDDKPSKIRIPHHRESLHIRDVNLPLHFHILNNNLFEFFSLGWEGEGFKKKIGLSRTLIFERPFCVCKCLYLKTILTCPLWLCGLLRSRNLRRVVFLFVSNRPFYYYDACVSNGKDAEVILHKLYKAEMCIAPLTHPVPKERARWLICTTLLIWTVTIWTFSRILPIL